MKSKKLTSVPKTLISQFSFIFLLAIAGCSSTPPIQEIPITANVTEEFNALDSKIKAAETNQLDLLSPHNFEKANAALKEAKKSLDNQKEPKETLHHIAIGQSYINRANEVSKLSQTNMEEVVIARQQAIDAGAPDFFSKDFDKADNRLRDVTSDLEDNKTKSAEKNRAALQASYIELEMAAIKHKHLNQAQVTINKAIKDGAKKYAPQTLAIAEKNYKDTEAYITANRHEWDQIKARSMAVIEDSDRLLKITHTAAETKKVSPEELALQMEKKQKDLTELSEEKENLEGKVDAKQSALAAEQVAAKSLEKEKNALEIEKAMNDKFEKARSEFTTEEAEVYKQGDTLAIRLRGLDFPTSKAQLKDSNFPLLGKVQRVIKEFGDTTVVVEGHTDSIGSKAKNVKLSEERAKAVREYLLSIDTLPESKIQAIGSGDQKPLATNKTASGRAQNRRVDVLIKVEKGQNL
jgi:outer membrane protein OmpA-like peptidoglycan-associated protein